MQRLYAEAMAQFEKTAGVAREVASFSVYQHRAEVCREAPAVLLYARRQFSHIRLRVMLTSLSFSLSLQSVLANLQHELVTLNAKRVGVLCEDTAAQLAQEFSLKLKPVYDKLPAEENELEVRGGSVSCVVVCLPALFRSQSICLSQLSLFAALPLPFSV